MTPRLKRVLIAIEKESKEQLTPEWEHAGDIIVRAMEWPETPDYDQFGKSIPACPHIGCSVCMAIFPTLPREKCPCVYLNRKYVRHTALALIKEYNKEKGKGNDLFLQSKNER